MASIDYPAAFPWIDPKTGIGEGGMSLRDWFASHASEADIAVRRKAVPADECRVIHSCTREEAKYAYADAMLAAREA